MIIDEDIYLEHFGIKGMRWGVRKEISISKKDNFSKEHTLSNRDKKVIEKHETIVSKTQERLDYISAHPATTFFQRRAEKQNVERLTEVRDHSQKIVDAKKEGKLTPTKKKILIGAGVAAALLVSYGAYKYTDSGDIHRLVEKGKAAIQGKTSVEWKKNEVFATKDLTPEAIHSLIVPGINPDYGAFGTKMNCRRATFAYEMRRRGFDVQATKSNGGRGQTVGGLLNALSPGKEEVPTQGLGFKKRIITEFYQKEAGTLDESRSIISKFGANSLGKKDIIPRVYNGSEAEGFTSAIHNALSSQPNGARGELSVSWKAGGAHSMAWEVIRGKAVIFDTQSGKKFETLSEIEEIGNSVSHAGFTRLDNVDLNHDFLLKWLK